MALDQFILLIFFVTVMVGSPGPANTLFLASGAAFGVRATLPFLAGTLSGFALVALSAGYGVAALFTQYPDIGKTIIGLSGLYILYLAYKIAVSEPSAQSPDQSFTFVEGLIVHPINPKAWLTAIACFAQFAEPGNQSLIQVLIIVTVFMTVGGALNMLWVAGGASLRGLVQDPEWMRVLNICLALLLVIVVAYLMFRVWLTPISAF